MIPTFSHLSKIASEHHVWIEAESMKKANQWSEEEFQGEDE